MKTEHRGSITPPAAAPDKFVKHHLAGFGCPQCDYKGWDAFVATGQTQQKQVRTWFWCPLCHNQFILTRQPWVWLGLRVLLFQIIGFAALYAVVMLVQGQPVPWLVLSGVSAAAVCVLAVFTMVLRSPASYRATGADSSFRPLGR